MPDDRKHGWTFWLTVALIVVPILYVTSFGPVCWATATPGNFSGWRSVPRFMRLYSPIGYLTVQTESLVGGWLYWWATLGVPDGYEITLSTGTTSAAIMTVNRRPRL